MKTVRLIHWNEDEGLERQQQLEAFGFSTGFDAGDVTHTLRAIRAAAPDAVVIDLSRMPSHGREVARALRSAKTTRHIPLVFVDGEKEKVAATKALLPDACYTTWGRIKTALPKAIANPVKTPVAPTDVMSAKPTVAKLGVKAGHKVSVISSPKGFVDGLKPLPAKVTFTARADASSDLFLCFVRTARELNAHVLTLRDAIDRQTLWMIWPKKASGVKSDLDGNVVRLTGLDAGWVDFKVCSVDATWSGLAFKRRR
jgi:CheY-like chemotaxis protein